MTIDRRALGWPSGEWDAEPDKVQWADAATGLPCLAVRNTILGHWCGYVGVAPGHAAHGLGYSDVDVSVHGGLTYSALCDPDTDEAHGICHTPAPGEPEHVWWLGFDCGHYDDVSPGIPWMRGGGTYKTLTYVQGQCALLAGQLQ